MNKPNIFKSNKFHLDAGDVVHILIKDLTGTGVTIGLNDGDGNEEDTEPIGFTTTLAPTTTEALVPYILAVTSPNGFLLRSVDDGVTFIYDGDIDMVGYSFCQLANGDILCIGDSDTVKNITQGTSVIIPTATQISCISSYNNVVLVGDQSFPIGSYFISDDWGATFNLAGTVAGSILDIFITSVDGVGNTEEVIFTNVGIYKNLVLAQAEWITATYDNGGGVMYAADDNVHLWKSIDSGATWNDLGVAALGDPITSIVVSGIRIIYVDYNGIIYYTDDDLATPYNTSVDTASVIPCMNDLIYVDTNVLLIGSEEGKVFRSTDNGTTWDEIAGNPQQGETQISSLIKIN